MSDEELAVGTAAEPALFGELYGRHERFMLAFFLRWTRSPEVAADLTAETFATALASIERYDAARGEFGGWLHGIGRHVLARSVERGRVEDRGRRRLGMASVHLDSAAIDRIEELASLDDAALRLLNELPSPLREAVHGRVLEEREYRELAEALACSEGVVRQRVSRGLRRLRDQLEAR